MANYCWVYGVIHFASPVGWLPVHRDQLRAQRSVTSMGKLYLTFTVVVLARLKEVSTRWNHRCLLFQCVPIFLKGRSFTSCYILCLFCTHWSVLSDLIFLTLNLISSNDGVGLWRWQSPLPSIMAFKSTCILTKSKTFDPHEKCGTYVNKTIFARKWRHSLRNNHYRPLYFLLVPISFRCPGVLAHR